MVDPKWRVVDHSAGDGYSNKSVAVTAMVATFACWPFPHYPAYTIALDLLMGLAYCGSHNNLLERIFIDQTHNRLVCILK